MATILPPTGSDLAVRCHDVTSTLATKQVADFDQLVVIGMAVRLALHLQGAATVPHDLLKQVGLHLLNIPTPVLPSVIDCLAEAEFIRVDRTGRTIRSIVPTVPFYEDLFDDIGRYAETIELSEPEKLTLAIVERLSKSPTSRSLYYDIGAEKRLVDRMLHAGSEGGYIIEKRARGKDMLLSPVYFPENASAFADLSAGAGSGKVSGVLRKLARNQGWPLALIKKNQAIGEEPITKQELEIVIAIASEGFSSPPAIKTSHHGQNFFLFTPKPGVTRIVPSRRHIYEAAMALVAAVRQGQLLPNEYRIKWPVSLLNSLLNKKYLRANTEALEQYRKLGTLRVGRLKPAGGSWFIFELIENPDNIDAVKMAIQLVSGEEVVNASDPEIVLAFQKGQEYADSLLGRRLLVEQEKVDMTPELRDEVDQYLLKL